MRVTIYHNPACGTSRNTLAMIRATGIEPTIIEYLRTPPTREELRDLVQRMGVTLRDLLDAPLPTDYIKEDGERVAARPV